MKETRVLITAVGPDRIGIVDQITEILLQHSGNIEASRMARLSGEFAALVLVSLPEDRVEAAGSELASLRQDHVEVHLRPVQGTGQLFEGYTPLVLTMEGADHEGIVRAVAQALRKLNVNIAELESHVTNAPTTGTTLFNMRATVQAPPELSRVVLQRELNRVGDAHGVAVQLNESTADTA